MDPDPDPYLVLLDPDPGGPKHTDPEPQHCRKECNILIIKSLGLDLPDVVKLLEISWPVLLTPPLPSPTRLS
jgi:hypothetical protein